MGDPGSDKGKEGRQQASWREGRKGSCTEVGKDYCSPGCVEISSEVRKVRAELGSSV